MYICFALIVLCSMVCHGAGHIVPWDLIKKYVPENPTIVEAGAQFGEDTKIMAEMWPGGRLYAFEPMPDNYSKLHIVAQEYDNVSASTLALTNEKKTANFWVCGGASSLLKPTNSFNQYFHADLEHPIQVECITLDEWCATHEIDKVDFLWFDMEGNELNALRGAEQILKTVQVIFIEVNFNTFWHKCVLYKDLSAWVTRHGFKEVWHSFVPQWNGNVIFVRN